jgi:hypothetical protein
MLLIFFCIPYVSPYSAHLFVDALALKGIQAVVTLNEDFELFVTSEHYKVVMRMHH